jgi:hypothetical protein
MALTGKYDFKGIAKLNALGLKALLASSPYSAWVLKGGKLTDLCLELLGNWLANWGLVVMNLGAIYVKGEVDQSALDKAINDGLAEIEKKGVTAKRGAEIDEAVRQAARDFIKFGSTDGMPDDADSGFQSRSDPSI